MARRELGPATDGPDALTVDLGSCPDGNCGAFGTAADARVQNGAVCARGLLCCCHRQRRAMLRSIAVRVQARRCGASATARRSTTQFLGSYKINCKGLASWLARETAFENFKKTRSINYYSKHIRVVSLQNACTFPIAQAVLFVLTKAPRPPRIYDPSSVPLPMGSVCPSPMKQIHVIAVSRGDQIPYQHPVLLSLLTDSLARSSIRHLRVNSRCLIGSPQRRNSHARAGTGQACGVPLHATAVGQRALACVPGRCARAHALGVHAVMAWVPAINRSRT